MIAGSAHAAGAIVAAVIGRDRDYRIGNSPFRSRFEGNRGAIGMPAENDSLVASLAGFARTFPEVGCMSAPGCARHLFQEFTIRDSEDQAI